MWHQLEAEIVEVCRGKIRRHERRRSRLAAEVGRRAKRSSDSVDPLSGALPELWVANPNLNPYDVLRRSSSLAYGIQRSISSRAYSPHAPTLFSVQKSRGSHRVISTFEIADEAVSRIVFRSLTRKNRSLFGAHTYAYREDVGIYDAVRYVSSEWAGRSRLFVAEYDLKAYFDSINRAYLYELLSARSVHATPLERSLCRAFLDAADATRDPHGVRPNGQEVGSGIPQGTTISLFLANLAMLPLDRRLEDIGVKFTRYADDILFWSEDYGTACRGVDALYAWSVQSGVALNSEKSRGLRLMSRDPLPEAELSSISSVDYLGHCIGLGGVKPKGSRIEALRNEIERMIYVALLKEPLLGSQRLDRIRGGLDRDYISLIWQLRRKLYGHLSERQVLRLRRGYIPATGLTGAVAQFPVVTDRADFRELDQWLRRRVWLALRRRSLLLRPLLGRRRAPNLWDLPPSKLMRASVRSVSTRQLVDLTMPSASLMAEVVERSIQLHGPGVVRASTRLYLAP